jgi:uncharacterized membrane protein
VKSGFLMDNDLVRRWIENGTITQPQADTMLADLTAYKAERGSNKFVAAISTIGALSTGIGAILFVAANWAAMSNGLRVLLLLAATLGSYYVGYVFQYERRNFPRVGASLIFLGALLFGATVFLVAQIYNVNANSHALVLIWLAGVLPFVYAFASPAIAGLVVLLFYGWIGLFVFKGLEFDRASGDFYQLPVLYLSTSVLMFGIGALHYLSDRLKNVARVYRLSGIKLAMVTLFFLSFRFYTEFGAKLVSSEQFTLGFVLCSILALLLSAVGVFFNPARSDTSTLENGVGFSMVAAALVVFFYPAATGFYAMLFNLVLAGLILTLLYVGYRREDMELINTGMLWLAVLVVVRYFDFFWLLLPRSIFFLIGGLILVFGGMMLERKRREIRAQFTIQPVM